MLEVEKGGAEFVPSRQELLLWWRSAEGGRVKARFKGERQFYPGKIAGVDHEGRVDILYDDGWITWM